MDQPRTDEDQPLVARTQAGDAAAFDELVVKYSPRLYGLIYNMTANHEDTNDLLQDVFAKAYRAIKGFRGKSSFYTWIHTIAVNMTLNFLKKRGRRYHLSLDDVDASIQNDKEFLELTATSSPVREADLGELHPSAKAVKDNEDVPIAAKDGLQSRREGTFAHVVQAEGRPTAGGVLTGHCERRRPQRDQCCRRCGRRVGAP